MHMLWISTLWGGWWAVRQDVLQERAKSYKFFWHQIIWKYWEKVDPAKTKAERQQEFGDRRRYEGGGQQKTLPENWQKVEIAKIRQQVFWGSWALVGGSGGGATSAAGYSGKQQEYWVAWFVMCSTNTNTTRDTFENTEMLLNLNVTQEGTSRI